MDSKESNSTPKSTILMISEDLEQINEFDEKNYQNRKYKFENLEQGKKFFKLRYIKDKIKIAMNKKSSDITVNKKLIPQLDDKEKEKLFNYENLLLNHNKTRQNYIQKYSRMFLILLEKSIFFFNSEKWQESYDILFNFDIIKNEAEFGEILLVISGYDKKLIGFNGENIIDLSKEYKKWRLENDSLLNKTSNDKKIVVIGAVMGSMILLTILYCLIKSYKTENSSQSSKFIEEQKFA